MSYAQDQSTPSVDQSSLSLAPSLGSRPDGSKEGWLELPSAKGPGLKFFLTFWNFFWILKNKFLSRKKAHDMDGSVIWSYWPIWSYSFMPANRNAISKNQKWSLTSKRFNFLIFNFFLYFSNSCSTCGQWHQPMPSGQINATFHACFKLFTATREKRVRRAFNFLVSFIDCLLKFKSCFISLQNNFKFDW